MSAWTISEICMCCDRKLTASGDDTAKVSADLDHMRDAAGWIVLPPHRERRTTPTVCRDCALEIAGIVERARALAAEGGEA